MNSLDELQNLIQYQFGDIDLLKQALTHVSYANENNVKSYERLEFLGDAVIELVVSDYIYNHLDFGAGDSTKLRAALVSTDYLCKLVVDLGIDKLVYKSKSLQQLSKKNIADIFESIVGAVYVEGGYELASNLINKYIIKNEENIKYVLNNNIDYKTSLQEFMQAQALSFGYEVVSSTGLDHEKVFEVALTVDGEVVAIAKANSIHLAEERCAEKYLTGKI